MSTNIYIDGNNIINIRQNQNNIQYSLNQSNNWITINFPCSITNTNTELGFVKVYFTTDITVTSTDQYFSCNSDNIQFGSDSLNPDGTKSIINVKTDYHGFIENVGNSNINIFNLFVNGIDGTTTYSTNDYAGWIGRNNFSGINIYIINCFSNGNINGKYSGGILGANASSYNIYHIDQISLYIVNCSSSGMIIGEGGGGIIGKNAYYIVCYYCWSSGSIFGDYAGGIVGADCDISFIFTSYSTGIINGKCSGGISSSNSAVLIYIYNSYSTGDISGEESGGICGRLSDRLSDFFSNNIVISNCYTTGNKIVNNAGGIIYYDININNNIIVIENCYVTGENPFDNGHIVNGYVGDDNYSNNILTILKCYSEAFHNGNGWNDTNASNANKGLTSAPLYGEKIGTSWVSTVANTPYRIFNMGYTPYSNKIIDKNANNDYDLIRQYSSSIVQGQNSSGAIRSDLSYRILQITDGNTTSYNSINIIPESGMITTTLSTSPGSYTIYISNNGYNGSIYFTTYNLTVSNRVIINMKSLFTDNSLVYYKPHSLSCGGIGSVKNYKAKCYKT